MLTAVTTTIVMMMMMMMIAIRVIQVFRSSNTTKTHIA